MVLSHVKDRHSSEEHPEGHPVLEKSLKTKTWITWWITWVTSGLFEFTLGGELGET